ncbi:hypothetical protein [Nocardia cyriacigeorgica]|uniref:hypothetical protein n=1 Tax=Nocardia cyriacigeorgica TaxID=135487 RepID=UPI002456A232|nr:hypothetical protein [Nocardia cyriacigeorgica]
MTRAVRDELRISTWNLWEHGMYPQRAGEHERYDRQARVMADQARADVWLLQEIGDAGSFVALAEMLGMDCMAASSGESAMSPVFDPGGRGFGVGVMWDPAAGITAVPGTRRIFTRDVFFHGVASVVLDLGDDRLLHVASGHATPWGAPQNIAEAKRWVSIMTRPNRGLPAELAGRVLPGVLGTDSNAVTGDRIRSEEGAWGYHAADPFEGQEWIADMVYQVPLPYERDERTGYPVPKADRGAGDVLWAGGLHDATAVLGLPVVPTTGYHPVDPYGPRDLDHLRVNTALLGALADVTVVDTDDVRASSDHRPKQLTLRRSLIPRTVPS